MRNEYEIFTNHSKDLQGLSDTNKNSHDLYYGSGGICADGTDAAGTVDRIGGKQYEKRHPFLISYVNLGGRMMTISGILMAVCTKLSIGGVFWAAAACMFVAAYHFRIRENKENEAPDDE